MLSEKWEVATKLTKAATDIKVIRMYKKGHLVPTCPNERLSVKNDKKNVKLKIFCLIMEREIQTKYEQKKKIKIFSILNWNWNSKSKINAINTVK